MHLQFSRRRIEPPLLFCDLQQATGHSPYIERLLGHLVRQGHEVVLARGPGPSGAWQPTELSGVRVEELPLRRSIDPAADVRALRVAADVMRRVRPDIVHAHNPKAGLVGMLAGRMVRRDRRPKLVYHVHGLPFVSLEGARRGLMKNTERLSCRLADRVIAVSASVRDCLLHGGLCEPNELVILGQGSAQGVDIEAFSPERCAAAGRELRARLGIGEEARVLLFVGRFHEEKGLDLLAQAWSRLERRVPDGHLLLVGRADEQARFDVQPLSRQRRVQVLGYLNDPRPAYAAADLLVLPTRREGLPTVILEAASMQVPSVATRVLGCVDAVRPEQTGRLVPQGDAAALADALALVLDDRVLREGWGKEARRWVAGQFAPGPILADLDRLYAELARE